MRMTVRSRVVMGAIAIALVACGSVWAADPSSGDRAPAATNAVPAVSTNRQAELTPEAAYRQMESLTEILMHVRKYYVEEKTWNEVFKGALHGMLQSLDPHSDYLEAEAFQSMQEDTAGKFSGIGIHIGMRDGMLTVIAPIEDTPAFRAGLQSQDRILAIDGQKTMNLPLGEAVKKLRGAKGTKVTITLARRNEEQPRDVEIVRDDIEVPSIKGPRMLTPETGYIRITQFAAPTAESFRLALEDVKGKGMKSLVLDLRRNPGGLLKSAIDVADLLLKKKDLIVTTKGRPGVTEALESRAEGNRHHLDFPIAVLVDGGSASASEIVAGALQDHKRAILIGETTFGKGSVQSVVPLKTDPKAAIRLTTALYYTPSGRQINDKGIEPDIPVPLSGEEWMKVIMKRAQTEDPGHFTDEEKKTYADVVDRQLERAVDILQAIRVFR